MQKTKLPKWKPQ